MRGSGVCVCARALCGSRINSREVQERAAAILGPETRAAWHQALLLLLLLRPLFSFLLPVLTSISPVFYCSHSSSLSLLLLDHSHYYTLLPTESRPAKKRAEQSGRKVREYFPPA